MTAFFICKWGFLKYRSTVAGYVDHKNVVTSSATLIFNKQCSSGLGYM